METSAACTTAVMTAATVHTWSVGDLTGRQAALAIGSVRQESSYARCSNPKQKNSCAMKMPHWARIAELACNAGRWRCPRKHGSEAAPRENGFSPCHAERAMPPSREACAGTLVDASLMDRPRRPALRGASGCAAHGLLMLPQDGPQGACLPLFTAGNAPVEGWRIDVHTEQSCPWRYRWRDAVHAGALQ